MLPLPSHNYNYIPSGFAMLEKPIPKTWEDKNALNRKIKPKQNTKAENWKLVDSPSNPKVSCLLFDPGYNDNHNYFRLLGEIKYLRIKIIGTQVGFFFHGKWHLQKQNTSYMVDGSTCIPFGFENSPPKTH